MTVKNKSYRQCEGCRNHCHPDEMVRGSPLMIGGRRFYRQICLDCLRNRNHERAAIIAVRAIRQVAEVEDAHQDCEA